MSKQEYFKLLKDPRWQKKRLEVMERDHFGCVNCGDNKSTLNIHHLIYFPNNKPWEYDDKFLITLCEECHEWEKNNAKRCFKELKLGLASCQFLNGGILALGEKFQKLIHPQAPEITVAGLCFALDNIGIIQEMYFAHLEELYVDKKRVKNEVV